MLGLTPARLRAYVRAGLLCPQRGHAGELRFSFQDLLLLRTAEGLITERLPPRRVRAALRQLQRRLPTGRPLTGVQLRADGGHLVVRDGDTAWRADSGQVLMAFAAEEEPAPAPVTALRRPAGEAIAARDAAAQAVAEAEAEAWAEVEANAAGPSAADLYQLGCELEDPAPEAARVAYKRALALDPDHADAHVNLGRLLHERGDLDWAEDHYRAALALRPQDPTALFNLGVVLEDRDRPDEAVESYEAALAVDPANADAHYNAARLHEVRGRYEAAVRHLREYRRLTRG